MSSIFRSLSDAVTAQLEPVVAALPALEQTRARAALADLVESTGGLEDGDGDFFCDALSGVIAAAEEVARLVLGAAATVADLIVAVLRTQLPALHTVLAALGVIAEPVTGRVEVEWEKLRDFLTDPARLVSEQEWDDRLEGHGHQLAALMGLLILAPKTIPALARGDLRAADLPVPPTDGPGPWRTFREDTAGWVSMTWPFGDAEDFLWQSGFADLPTGTIAIRSERRPDGTGRTRTDFEMWLVFSHNRDRWEVKRESGWFARVEPGVTSGVAFDGQWHGRVVPSSAGPLSHPVGPDDTVAISFGREQAAAASPPGDPPDLIFGPPYDTRLVVQDIGFAIEVRKAHPVVELALTVRGFAVVLTNRWFRSLGATNTSLRNGLRFDFDLDLALVEGQGLLLNLEAGLRTTYFVNKKFTVKKAKIRIHSVSLALPVRATQSTFDTRAEVTFHVSAEIGPVTIVLDGAGGWVGWWADPGETDKDCVGLLPPTGAGLDVRTSVVQVGGFLDFTGGPDDRFGGVLHGRFLGIEILAFGLHRLTGRAGDTDRSASVVVVLGIRFNPSITLGYGIRLAGVGGLVAVNRRVDTDALRERLTSGAAGNVLFCENPVQNAPALLGDLDALFPAADGTHVVGPTVRLTWLEVEGVEFFTVDLGLFFELPGPSKVVVLGSARAEVKRAGLNLLQLRLDLVGFVDLVGKKIEVDATLISSRALGIFKLTGDAALRASWGDPPVLLLTLGGFHPDFDPAPAVVPKLTRLALTLDIPGVKKPKVELRGEAYVAVTTNTLQFGGKLEAAIKSGNWNIHGFVSLDAIIQFSPLWFEVSVSVGVAVRWKSHNLAGVKLTGTISGPGPFTVAGKVCIELLFFDVCWSDSFVLGDGAPPPPPVALSVVQELRRELQAPSNLTMTGGEDRQALVGPPAVAGPRPLMSPLGALVWAQPRVPLGVLLDRLDGEPLSRQQAVAVTAPVPSVPVQDWFSPGSFANLNVAEALNRPTFERLDAGLALTFGPTGSATVDHDVAMIEVRLPRPFRRPVAPFVLPALVVAGTRERTAPAGVRTTAPRVAVHEERYAVRQPDGSVVATGRSRADAFQRARVAGAVAVPIADLVDVGTA